MAELKQFVSDVLLGQVNASDAGYNFEQGTVTWSTGMKAGAALKLVAGKYVWAAIADVANVVGVLVDQGATDGLDGDKVDATDYEMIVAKRGCTINKNTLTLSDGGTAGNITSAAEAFEAAGANKVTDKVES